MKLTEAQKEDIAKVVESLEVHPVYDSCASAVFDFEEKGVTWQLQVKIVQDPDDFMEKKSA
jgi:hypothetical protein